MHLRTAQSRVDSVSSRWLSLVFESWRWYLVAACLAAEAGGLSFRVSCLGSTTSSQLFFRCLSTLSCTHYRDYVFLILTTWMMVGQVCLVKVTFCFNRVLLQWFLHFLEQVAKFRFQELGLYFIAFPPSSSWTIWRQSEILILLFVTPCELSFDSEQRSLLSISSWSASHFVGETLNKSWYLWCDNHLTDIFWKYLRLKMCKNKETEQRIWLKFNIFSLP